MAYYHQRGTGGWGRIFAGIGKAILKSGRRLAPVLAKKAVKSAVRSGGEYAGKKIAGSIYRKIRGQRGQGRRVYRGRRTQRGRARNVYRGRRTQRGRFGKKRIRSAAHLLSLCPKRK